MKTNMSINISDIILQGERVTLECKKAQHSIPTSLWDTYSAFANTYGGTILLGVVEHIDEHDVDHRLYECVRPLAAHMREFVCPARIVVVLYDAKLKLEEVGERKELALGIVRERLHEVEQMNYSLLVHLLTISGGEEVHLAHGKLVVVVELLDALHQLHHLVG